MMKMIAIWACYGIRGIVAVFTLVTVTVVVAQAQQGDNRLSGLKLDQDKPIVIESDQLEVREADHTALFSGNVSVEQGTVLLKTMALTVYYAEDGGSAATGSANIERLVADGKVYVRSEQQVATGDQGSYDMTTQVLVLSGESVVLTEGENSAIGCKLTMNLQTGVANLESCNDRVRILISPKSAKQ